jgi:hypothetical protein
MALAALVLFGAFAARAELVRVEAVGSVPLGAASSGGAAARQAALEAGIREAIERSAMDLARQAGASPDPDAVRAAIGSDPKGLAARYRILEDRGERAPLLESSPGAQREYVVAVEVEVDRAALRARLVRAGIVTGAAAPAGAGAHRIVLEGVDAYAVWARARDALTAKGEKIAAVEFAPGRIVATLGAPESERALVTRIAAGLGEGFEVSPLGSDGDAVRVGIARRPPPPDAPSAPDASTAAPPAP